MYNQYPPFGNSYMPYYGNTVMQNQRGSLFRRGINPSGVTKPKFNWSNFLNNTQRTLGIINQAIPIVYQVRPMLNNAKTMFRIASAIGDVAATEAVIEEEKEQNSETQTNQNAPQFFL